MKVCLLILIKWSVYKCLFILVDAFNCLLILSWKMTCLLILILSWKMKLTNLHVY